VIGDELNHSSECISKSKGNGKVTD